jgi:hypothetical protein
VLLTTFLTESIKSGKIKVSQSNTEALEITVQDKKIDVNAKDKDFIKDIIFSSVRKDNDKSQKGIFGTVERSVASLRTLRNMQPMLIDIAEDLQREGVTVIISFKGDTVITMGSKANPKLTRYLLGTKSVEINSIKKIVEMGL